MFKILVPAVTSLLLLSPILGKWTTLGNNGTTYRTDIKIGIWSILKVRNPKMESLFENFENFTTCCDVIISNFTEMDQMREQRNYLPVRHQNWYLWHFEGEKSKNELIFSTFSTFHHLLCRQIPILVSVRQVVPLFPNLVHCPKIGDNDVTAGGKILNIFKK